MSRWIDQLLFRLHCLFRRRRIEQELDDEMGYRLERLIDEGPRAGLSPQGARYAALRALGPVTQSK